MTNPGPKILGILSLLSVLVSFSGQAVAGVTGKIAGKVIAVEDGQPLIGANVMIAGTSMGAASDHVGNYIVLNVPPGTYDLIVTMIGYRRAKATGVRVRIDQTARVEFTLEMETLAGETVTIVADQNPIREDVATSVASFSNDDVQVLPLNSVEDVVELQAGVQNGLEIRGGGIEEALFQVDGITLRDPRNNQPISGIALSAIQEISIERGGFNAEYGQVRSGIVNVVTREGGKDKYQTSMTVKYGAPSVKYFGLSPYSESALMMRPYVDDEVCWTGTDNGSWNLYEQRQFPTFDGWNAVSRALLTDGETSNDLSPAAAQQLFLWQHRRRPQNDQPDYNIDAGFGGPVPYLGRKLGNLRFFTSYRREREMLLIPLSRDDYWSHDWSIKLTSDIRPSMKLNFSTMIGENFSVAQNEAGLDASAAYLRSPEQIATAVSNMNSPRATSSRIFSDSYFSQARVRHKTFALKLTHMLNAKTFYEAGIEHIRRRYLTEPIGLRNPAQSEEYIPGHLTSESPFGFNPNHEPGIDGMMTGGHTSTVRDNSRIHSTTFKFDLSSQIDYHNLVKAGIEFVTNDLNFDYGEVKELYTEGNTTVRMHKFPVRGALYVQDKLELNGLVVNAGLRLDYSNTNTWWPHVASFDKDFYSSNYLEDQAFATKKAESQWSLSPRLGISHPITENSKLFFNYGHFKQLPTYEQIFRMARGGSNEIQNIGNPELNMEKTIAYELGYDHSLFKSYLFQLAAYYKDISNQRDLTLFLSADGSVNYNSITNHLYEDIRGFEMTLRKTTGRWWTAFLNYTYQVSTQGHFDRAEIYQDPSLQREYDRSTRQLYQERPIPSPFARASLTFSTPRGFGPQLLGTKALEQWNLNFIADYREGQWLTWNPSRKLNVAMNVQERDYFNLRLRLTKTISLKSMDFTLFVDMDNVLNTKRLSLYSFYDSHDFNYYFQSLHLPQSNDYDNIVGEDRIGDFRDEDTDFQPIERVGHVRDIAHEMINETAIYYETTSRRYLDYNAATQSWSEVESGRLDKIIEEKAYIDMPNHQYFRFLNPRRIFFGIRASFNL